MTESGSAPPTPIVCVYGGHGRVGMENLKNINKEELNEIKQQVPDEYQYYLNSTCWFNSVIQCLGHTDPLRKFFFDTDAQEIFDETKNREANSKYTKVAYAIHILILQMWSNQYTIVRPDDAIATFLASYHQDPDNPDETTTRESKAEVFYDRVYDCLRSAYDFETTDREEEIQNFENFCNMPKMRTELDYIEEDLEFVRIQDRSKPMELFLFFETHELTCIDENCAENGNSITMVYRQHYIETSAINYGITPNTFSTNLVEILQNTYNSQPILSTMMHSLYPKPVRKMIPKECNESHLCLRKRMIFELPTILVIQLEILYEKGRAYDEAGKEIPQPYVSFPVEFGKTLDMAPYMHELADKVDTEYELYAIICINDPEPDKGHYYAYAKKSHDTKRDEQQEGWFRFDDASVRIAFLEEIFQEGTYKRVNQLFYRRIVSDPKDPIYSEPKFEEPQPKSPPHKGKGRGRGKDAGKEKSGARPPSSTKRKKNTTQESSRKKTPIAPTEYESPDSSDHDDFDIVPDAPIPDEPPQSDDESSGHEDWKEVSPLPVTGPEPILEGLESAAAVVGMGHDSIVSHEEGHESLPATRGKGRSGPKAPSNRGKGDRGGRGPRARGRRR